MPNTAAEQKEKEFNEKLKLIGDLYESGKDAIHSMSILSDELEHRDHLYDVLKQFRDLAATQAKQKYNHDLTLQNQIAEL